MVAQLTLSIRFPIEPSGELVAPPSGGWQTVAHDVERLRDLTADCDGNGATPPQTENIEAAARWVAQMPQLDADALPPSQVTAGTLGEVLLVWQSVAQSVEAEIAEPDTVEWMVKVADAEPEFCSTPIGRAVVLSSPELMPVNG